jgi:hypothetical protein
LARGGEAGKDGDQYGITEEKHSTLDWFEEG